MAATGADIAVELIRVGGAVGTIYFAARAAASAKRALDKSAETQTTVVETHHAVQAQAPVIKSIDDAVNNRRPGEETLAAGVRDLVGRADVADAAAAEAKEGEAAVSGDVADAAAGAAGSDGMDKEAPRS